MHLKIHSVRPDAHDYLEAEGSHGDARARLRAAVAAGETAVVTTPLTRASYADLARLPTWLRSRSASAWTIEFGAVVGPTPPRLAICVPHALIALQRAFRVGLPAFVRGIPLCLLGPMAAKRRDVSPRSFAPCCGECAARRSCPGLPDAYLARFEGDELRPRTDNPEAIVVEQRLRDAFDDAEL